MNRFSVTLGAFVVTAATFGIGACVGDDAVVSGGGDTDSGNTINEAGPPGDDSSAPPSDAGSDTNDAAAPECDPTKPFGTPVPVVGVNDETASDEHAVFTSDELTIFFGSDRQAPPVKHIFTSTRATKTSAFPTPVVLNGAYTAEGETDPAISPDGRRVVFDSLHTAPGNGATHLFFADRESAAVNFLAITAITGDFLNNGSLTAAGDAVYVADLSSGGIDRMAVSGAVFGSPLPLANVATDYSENAPMSMDDVTLYVRSGRPGNTQAGSHIWVHTRASATGAYGAPSEVPGVNTFGDDAPSWLSPNGCRLYITHSQVDAGAGKSDIFVASKPL